MTTAPLRSTTATIDIYIKLAQYPILSDKIRERMREELFSRGIVSEQEFEKEVKDLAIESQKRERIYDPFSKESTSVWHRRRERIRNFHTDFYFGNNLPHALFESIVQEALNQGEPNKEKRIELNFNPELAPWGLLFQQGEIYESLNDPEKELARHHLEEIKVVLIKGMISDHLRFVGLAKKILTISDLKRIYNRRIGEGKIGGKAAGMVLAWRILRECEGIGERVEIPDSYFIGSEVIYDLRTMNNLDHTMNQKYLPLDKVREEYPKVLDAHLKAKFPKEVVEQLSEVLALMDNSPIIVRSSSLLEDNFGFAFAGKYDSFFCPNQGTAEENLENLLNAIRRIYASVLNPDAIAYRQKRGLIDYDERMGILLQRVRGKKFGRYYFPPLAGVGFSQNAYRWHEKIKREDGFLRLVWGMGTRAVDRVSDDYPRLVGLSQPHLRPETTASAVRQYSQHYIDLIDLEENQFKTLPVDELLSRRYPDLPSIASVDHGDYLSEILSRASVRPDDHLVLTFDRLTQDTRFTDLMRNALKELEKAYEMPVDIEFTVEILRDGSEVDYKLHLLQCRPLSQRVDAAPVELPKAIPEEDLLFTTEGLVPDGQALDIRYIVYVDPIYYKEIPDQTTKLELGRAISRLNRQLEKENFVLMGPGRWGSTNLELGVRVSYADINNTQALIEIGIASDGSAPELSYGTHFFQDLVESGIHSLPLHLSDDQGHFDWNFFRDSPNSLGEISPPDQNLAKYLRVIDASTVRGRLINILMNGQLDKAICYFQKPSS